MTDPDRTSPSAEPRRVVSGVRATGRMHLGNYLGAVRTFVNATSQPSVEGYFFFADLLTLTTLRDPDALRTGLLEIAMDYIAAGIDPEKFAVYVQSNVPETSELAWLFSCVTYVGELERVPNFRERERQRPDGEPLNVGLLSYPLLMAADILGPRAHRVAAGEDQYPHFELVRDIARRFNRRFHALFPEPVAAPGEPVRVPGLDGSGKMGKVGGNTISFADTREQRWSCLERAVIDPGRRTQADAGTPEHCGVYAMHQLVSPAERVREVATACRSAKLQCVDCKHALDDGLETVIAPVQLRRRTLAEQPGQVREILHAGAVRARATVRATRDAVQDAVGIVRY